MTFRSIYWDGDEARLRSFSATSKSGATSIIKIEIEVSDPFRLGAILQNLEELRREQNATSRPAPTSPPKRTASGRRAINSQTPLMLTYRKDDVL